jgi:hypothetical protein
MKKPHKEQTEEEHVKTCFRCRLHALMVELYPTGITDMEEGQFILVALAEAAGQMLADYEEQDFHTFLKAVIRFHNARVQEDDEETKH